jgi:hypothetical protein
MFDKFTIIGYPNNTADSNNLGGVAYEFLISKTMVSIEEYCTLLNNIACIDDPHRLYKSGMQKFINRQIVDQNIKYSIIDEKNKTNPITYINIDDAK